MLTLFGPEIKILLSHALQDMRHCHLNIGISHCFCSGICESCEEVKKKLELSQIRYA